MVRYGISPVLINDMFPLQFGKRAGCMKIELFADVVPKTAENFR